MVRDIPGDETALGNGELSFRICVTVSALGSLGKFSTGISDLHRIFTGSTEMLTLESLSEFRDSSFHMAFAWSPEQTALIVGRDDDCISPTSRTSRSSFWSFCVTEEVAVELGRLSFNLLTVCVFFCSSWRCCRNACSFLNCWMVRENDFPPAVTCTLPGC